MFCPTGNCQEIRSQLRAALLELKISAAVGLAVTGAKEMINGARSMGEEGGGAAGDVSQADDGHLQGKRSRRRARDYDPSGEGRADEGQDSLSPRVPDGVDGVDAEDRPESAPGS